MSTDPVVVDLLGRLDAVDPSAAADAAEALGWLLDDGGLESLNRCALEQFLWYELPFKWARPPAARAAVVHALARLFDLAGLARYADRCRNPGTAEVHAAWDAGVAAGFAAYRRAARASAVEPPHLEELSWGELMGEAEHRAWWSTAEVLELAQDAGLVQPGRRGVRAEAARVAADHLTAPRPELLGECLLDAVLTERVVSWVEGPDWSVARSRARSQLVAPAAELLVRSGPRPPSPALPALDWLVDEGVGRRADGRGPGPAATRAWVSAAPTLGRGWGAGLVDPVPAVWAVARAAGLVRVRHGRIGLGPQGAADPWHRWKAAASALLGSAVGPLGEVAAAVLLVERRVELPALHRWLQVAATEMGLGPGPAGRPVPDRAVEAPLGGVVAALGGLGLLDGRLRADTVALSAAGRAVVHTALRARATQPRGGPAH